MRLSKEDKVRIYNGVMESLHTTVTNVLNELSQQTVDNAARKTAKRNLDLLSLTQTGVFRKMRSGWKIDPKKFEAYIETVDNPKRKERLVKMYKNNTLADYLLRQQHYFATMALNKLEWLRDNTDVPISPEFYEGAYSDGRSVSDRKPTKEEHDFYRYMTSMGTDTEGINHDDLVRYRDAFCRFYDETQGIKSIWDMVPEIK